ncbi:MAG: hypothetical protein ACRC2T_19640 [Thermoguttaceae bacterium]
MKNSLKNLIFSSVTLRGSILLALFAALVQITGVSTYSQERRYYNYGYNTEPEWLRANSGEKVICYGTQVTGVAQETTNSMPYQQKKVLSKDEVIEGIKLACSEAKEKVVKPTDSDLVDLRKKTLRTVDVLNQKLSGKAKSQDAAQLKETLKLSELKKALSSKDGFDSVCISETFQGFQDNPEMFKEEIFTPLKEIVRQYLVVEMAVNDEKFTDSFAAFCDGFPKIVEMYLVAEKPEYLVPMADAMIWLTDLGTKVDSAKQITDFVREAFEQPNFFAYVSADFIAAGFEKDIDEPVDVQEIILGTRVRGNGTIVGKSTATLRPNNNKAEIQVLLDTNISTRTVGVNGPVTITNQNSGPLTSEKSIYITGDKICAAAAASDASIVSQTVNLCINGGHIVQKIARNKVQQKKPAAQAEANRRAEVKFSKRFDNEVNPKITELNDRFQNEFRKPLIADGYFPEVLDLRTTAEELIATVLLAPKLHPSTYSAPPTVNQEGTDFVIELNQSLPNNLAKLELSGRRVEEGKMIANLKEKYPKLAENLNRDEEQPELAVTFANKSPLAVSFAGDVVTLCLHFDKLEQEGQSYPGLDITVKYRIRSEEIEENGSKCTKLVFELVETPSVFPPGFDPNGGKTLSGREQLIRNIVMQRMDKSLKKSFEMKPIELQGQWEGRGKLYPSLGTAENGWLVLGWTWK